MARSFNERKQVSRCLSTAQIAALKDQLSGSGCVIHEPGSRGYAQATRLWNGTVERKAALVTACQHGRPSFGKRLTLPRAFVLKKQAQSGSVTRCEVTGA